MINIIAEIGINHNGDMKIALEMLNKAKECGATHVKFQKRNPDVCVPEHQKNQPKSTPWGEITYLQYKYDIEFGLEEYQQIDTRCKELGIEWFVSVWDLDSVDFIHRHFTNSLVKIPSAKAVDYELITQCKQKFNKILISTGMCTKNEIEQIVDLFQNDKHKLVLLHTVSAYPAPIEVLHIDTLDYLKTFGVETGYSSHEQTVLVAPATVYKGVNWIERHFTLDKTMWGTDQSASSNPDELTQLVECARLLESTLGIRTGVLECEKDNLKKMR
jgi:N-acetylneuraminate synthase